MRTVWTVLSRYPIVDLTIAVGVAVLILTSADAVRAAQWLAVGYVSAIVAWTLIGMVRDVLRGHVGLDILAVVAMVAAVPLAAGAEALLVSALLTALLAALVVAEQLRGAR